MSKIKTLKTIGSKNKDWLIDFFKENYVIILALIFFLLAVAFFSVVVFGDKRKKTDFPEQTDSLEGSVFCPVRGQLRVRKFDVRGRYTEEYRRVELIVYLLKKGFHQKQITTEHSIQIGHKGRTSLKVDLVVWSLNNPNTALLVAEVKKSYSKKTKKSALHHQLIPAMQLLGCKKGIYYDGTPNSCVVVQRPDGTSTTRRFSL